MKERVYLLPVYIASLKYYEKLLPSLRARYDARFLIIRPDDERRRGMLSYCAERGLPVDVLSDGLEPSRLRFPFVSAALKRIRHQNACRALLLKSRAAKIVAVKTISTFEPIFRAANALCVETLVLQSALTAPRHFYRPDNRKARPSVVYRAYQTLLRALFLVTDLLTQGAAYVRASAHPRRVGVIGPEGVAIYAERFGYKKETVAVVGNAEYQQVAELCARVKRDEAFRASLLATYRLDASKKRILIMSVWFAHHGAVRPTHRYSPEEVARQVEHYRRLIAAIRERCEPARYEILFKLHPAERNIYESYEQYDVRFFGDEANSEELLALSDLYIADPCTSANYMVVASGVPAIFDNTEALPALNKCTLFYPMTRIVQNLEECKAALASFTAGTLDLGYDPRAIDPRSIDRIAAFIAG